MPNATVRASATALPKAKPAVDQRAPDPQRDFIEDLSILPDRYAMNVSGHCLEPEIPDGSCVLIDKTAPYKRGDLVMVYRRIEKVPAGVFQAQLKRLVMAPPSWVTFPYSESPQSEIAALVVIEMINPSRQFAVRCADILGIHKCLGIMPPDMPRVRMSLAEARKAAAAGPKGDRQ